VRDLLFRKVTLRSRFVIRLSLRKAERPNFAVGCYLDTEFRLQAC
jgi:hypothetical protein